MKKKNMVLICMMILLGLGVVILPFCFARGAMNNYRSEQSWTQDITVEDGVVTPDHSETDFTIDKGGSWRIAYSWMQSGTDVDVIADISTSDLYFLTVIQIFDSKGEQVFATCAGCLYADTLMELEAGHYSVEYTYFTDRDSFIDFAKENICSAREAALIADESGFESFRGDGVVPMSYHIKAESEESDLLVSTWVLLIILFLILLVVSVACSKRSNEYDERQQQVRGKAYGLGFFTNMASIFVAVVIDALELFPAEDYILCAAAVFPGMMVFLAYSIWNEAYFSLKEKEKSMMAIFGIMGICNLIIAINAVLDGRMWVNGRLGLPILNVLCAAMFLEIFTVVLLKKISASKETEED